MLISIGQGTFFKDLSQLAQRASNVDALAHSKGFSKCRESFLRGAITEICATDSETLATKARFTKGQAKIVKMIYQFLKKHGKSLLALPHWDEWQKYMQAHVIEFAEFLPELKASIEKELPGASKIMRENGALSAAL